MSYLSLPDLNRVMALIDTRLDICEQDLDCDIEGSLAQAIGDLRDDINGLRARLDEWITDRAREAA